MNGNEQQGPSGNNSRPCQKDGSPPLRPRTRMLFVIPIICVLLAHASIPEPAVGQQDSAGEYELKAAMLYNLIQFIEWPRSAYSDLQAPTVLCILGRDPFGNTVTSLASDKLVRGRPVQIRHLKDIDGTRACHVLYISSSERNRLERILSNLKGSNVLTVGEMGQFAAHGGMVQFALYEKRVLFEINLDAANRGGVKISSRLLAIARVVKDQGDNSSRIGSSTNLQKFVATGPSHNKKTWEFTPGIGDGMLTRTPICADWARFGSHSSLQSC